MSTKRKFLLRDADDPTMMGGSGADPSAGAGATCKRKKRKPKSWEFWMAFDHRSPQEGMSNEAGTGLRALTVAVYRHHFDFAECADVRRVRITEVLSEKSHV